MTFDWIDRLSDWNPQVFRELKGRLKRTNASSTSTTSFVIQLLVLLYFWNALPADHPKDNPYCTGSGSYRSFACIYDALGNPQIDWQHWWFDLFQALSWALPFVLLIAGVYMLIGDLGKEERRGTLNFIRLSPQTSHSILVGKLLGVPAIPYLAVALAVPLHLLAAIAAHVSIANVLSIYLLTAAACAFFYSAALLYAFLGGTQGWLGAVIIWLSYSVFFQLWQSATDFGSDHRYLGLGEWFYLPVGKHLGLAMTFALITLGAGTYWPWQAAKRRFRNPNLTLLSKSQSYRVTLCFEIWMLGFVFRDVSSSNRPLDDLVLLGFFSLLWFVILMVALTPQRQILLDWARYRRERVAKAKHFWSRSIVEDLIWGEKSPALVAIALNLLLANAVIMPWLLGWGNASYQLQGLATLVLGGTYLLICAAIAQLMMLMKSPKRAVWAASTIAGIIALPPAILGFLQFYPTEAPLAWLFSMGAFAALQSSVSITTIFTAFLGHLGILSLLSLRLSNQLQRAGESATKALLASKA